VCPPWSELGRLHQVAAPGWSRWWETLPLSGEAVDALPAGAHGGALEVVASAEGEEDLDA
jgi:hypothetical protein